MADVEVEKMGNVLVLRLNRPERKNAIGGAMLRLLLDAFRAAHDDDGIRAVVTSAKGPTFCVGADVETLATAGTKASDGRRPNRGGHDNGLPPPSAQSERVDRIGIPGRWITEMMKLDKPTVAAVSGAAAGGGLCLATLHDFRVAAPSTRFVAGFVKMGLAPEMGLSHTLPRIVGTQMARRMLVANEMVSGQTAQSVGLVDRLADEGQVEKSAIEYAEALAALPPLSVRSMKQLVRRSATNSFEDSLVDEYSIQLQLFQTNDHQEAIRAFQTKRPGAFNGS